MLVGGAAILSTRGSDAGRPSQRRGLPIVLATILGASVLAISPTKSLAYTRLPFEPVDMVVDAAHEQVFITGGAQDKPMLVANFDGEIVHRLTSGFGAMYMELAGDSLYVSMLYENAIHELDTTTLEVVRTIDLGADVYPGSIALAGNYLWFGECGPSAQMLGSVELTTGLVQMSDGPAWPICPGIEAVPGSETQIVVFDPRALTDFFPVTFYDVVAGRVLRERGTVRGSGDVRFIADGTSFVTCVGPRVQRYQTSDLAPIETIPLACSWGLDQSADGRTVGVSRGKGAEIHREGRARKAVWRTEDSYILPRGLRMTPDGKRLFALTARSGTGYQYYLNVIAPTVKVRGTNFFEYRPSGDGNYLAWTQRKKHNADVNTLFVIKPNGRRIRVNAKGTEGFMGAIDGTRLAYQQIRGRKSDIMFYDLARNRRRSASRKVNSPMWEYFPSLSGQWLLFARVNDRVTERRVMLANLKTGRVTTIDRQRGRAPYIVTGQMNGRFATWVKCSSRCDIFRYDAVAKKKIRLPNPKVEDSFGPSVTKEGTVYFGRGAGGCGRNIRLMKYEDGDVSLVMDLPHERDFYTSFVYEHDGKTGLYLDLLDCPEILQQLQSDIWVIDDL